MTTRQILQCCGLGVLLLSALTLACARAPKARVPSVSGETRGGVSVNQARELLQRLLGANWNKQQVELKSIANGIGGDNAVVEAQIETAYRFARDARGEWRVAEIRLGDAQWESIELIEMALRREKERRTQLLLERIAASLQSYRAAQGNYIASEELAVALDFLAPRYLTDPVRVDLWQTPLRYRGTATSYQLCSAGADRKFDTTDDLVLSGGQ